MLFVKKCVDVVESLTDCFLRCPCLFQGVESRDRDLTRAPRLGEGGLNLLCFVHILIVTDLDNKAAEVEEERKMQEAAMLLKHQETPGGSHDLSVFENLSQVSQTETTPASTSRTRRTSTSR